MAAKKQKTSLVVIGLVAVLLLFETSLRLAGFFYRAYRVSNVKIITTKEDKDIVKILCLGDSFTFGLGAEPGFDYPAQLARILNAENTHKRFIVYNGSIPGQNSSMVLKNLVSNVNTYKPDIILLLIGTNDRTVLEDSNYYLFRKPADGKLANFFLRADIALSKLRTYKLIRTAVLNLGNKFKSSDEVLGPVAKSNLDENNKGLKEGPAENRNKNEHYLSSAQDLYNERNFSTTEKIIKEIPGGYNLLDKRECLLLGNIYCEEQKYDLAFAAIGEYIKNNPRDSSALLILGKIYYMRGKNFPLTREEDFNQALRIFEESLSYADVNDLPFKREIYSYLARLHVDRGEKDLATSMMQGALKCHPNDKFFQQFLRVISEPSLSKEENEMFDKLLYYNLGRIISLCRLYNVEIILLNYPPERDGGIRMKIAEKYGVPFINIGSKFTEALSAKDKLNNLFSNDMAHPNANGYRIIAESICGALNSTILK